VVLNGGKSAKVKIEDNATEEIILTKEPRQKTDMIDAIIPLQYAP